MDTLVILGILLLVTGFILVGIEMCIPGFGVPGISGIACLVGGILLTARNVGQGLTITMVVVAVPVVMLTLILLVLKRVKPPLILEEDLKATPEHFNASHLEYLVGKEGITSTDLKPSGKCDIEGVEFDVRAESRYMKKGTRVRISRIHENAIMIKEI